MSSVFFNKGENCIAAGRLFVEDSIHDQFVRRVVGPIAGTDAARSLAAGRWGPGRAGQCSLVPATWVLDPSGRP